ncbi:hypothetical protein J6590_030186 [Homalodisca vitripennis]|nr:hypothetical protein J6590_030186 [Homalodisca vitripennis]
MVLDSCKLKTAAAMVKVKFSHKAVLFPHRLMTAEWLSYGTIMWLRLLREFSTFPSEFKILIGNLYITSY